MAVARVAMIFFFLVTCLITSTILSVELTIYKTVRCSLEGWKNCALFLLRHFFLIFLLRPLVEIIPNYILHLLVKNSNLFN